MPNKAILTGFGLKADGLTITVQFRDSGNVVIENKGLDIDFSGVNNFSTLNVAAKAAVMAYAGTQGWTVTAWDAYDPEATGLTGLPQAAITAAATNAVTNLPTNYNLVSGLLGIANGLNDANSAQNDLATKFNAGMTKLNTLLTELKACGVLA